MEKYLIIRENSETKSVQLGGNAGMWICFDPTESRVGWGTSISFVVLLYWASITIDASLTNAAASNVPRSTVTSEVSLPAPAHHDNDECRNVTTDNREGTGLSVVSHESRYPHSPIVPPTFLYGALTCQPYQGIYVNHIYFQLANAFFLLSHLAPSGIHGVLYLRCTLLVGCAFLALWGWTIACWLDAALWNALFVAINFVHVCTLLYKLRPIKFTREIEEWLRSTAINSVLDVVYIAVFQPLRVSRHQFRKVLNCMKVIRQLKYQEVYAQEKVTKVDSLSLVLSGKLVVSQSGRALHIVFPHQFLDSPEWFGVSTDEYFQAVFDHILGRDVVKKLMQVSETMAASNHQQQNGQIIGLGGIGALENDPDTKLFVVKKTGDSQGITALISRQLQAAGDPNAWRLGRIEETDHETPV
ncbi:blood vessel epicardial substance [Lasius niger]|uniref:Blood vessel epicardial substance n=1 Tax=Lasius niger TaxID=67767 RepID=A0A0J7P3C9_LASNI|nr:blood vessel epicardial substance [Lasius niger]